MRTKPENPLVVFARLIRERRDLLIDNWAARIRSLPDARPLGEGALKDEVGPLCEEIADALIAQSEGRAPPPFERSPREHGRQRLAVGFDLSELVLEYNILRDCLFDLADRENVDIHREPERVVHAVLDRAIGLSVTAYTEAKADEVKERRSRYLSSLTHDLRTPIAAISYASEALATLTASEGSETVKQLIEVLQRNVAHVDAMLLEVVLEERNVVQGAFNVEPTSMDLWPAVEAVRHRLAPLAHSRGARVVNRVPANLSLRADEDALVRILENLISNAIRYSPGGEVAIGALQRDDVTEWWVSDSGKGMPLEQTERLLHDPKGAPDGSSRTGLGLSIVKQLVEAHGGAIEVESRPGEGATFRMRFPRS